MKKKAKVETFVNSSGDTVEYEVAVDNIFADLDLPDADELLVKSQLVNQISVLIRERDWNQSQAAAATGLTQPKISALLRGKVSGFSMEKLFEVLNRLGCDVEVRVKTRQQAEHGETHAVLLAA